MKKQPEPPAKIGDVWESPAFKKFAPELVKALERLRANLRPERSWTGEADE